jgi:carbamoylphosphate synthase large subunit
VHVQSSYELQSIYHSSFRENDFIANVRHDGDFDTTLTTVKGYSPECVLVGTEIGVEMADLLSQRLGVLSNGVALSSARRDKFLMAERVSNRGLRSVRHLQSQRAEDIITWAERVAGWPVVIKPVHSAGNDSVLVCKDRISVLEGFRRIHGATNRLGLENRVVLGQEMIRGTNYVVDTVTCRGQHYVSNIWKVTKGTHNGADFVYEYTELLPFEGEVQKALVGYTFGVLDALGIQHGPGHSEVMYDSRGPVLIETGARVHGGGIPSFSRVCTGFSQVELTVDCYVDPKAYESKVRTPYRIGKNLMIVDLISRVEGRLRALPLVERVKRLRSFHQIKVGLQPGDAIHKTVDLFTSPGCVALVHEDMPVIQEDYEMFRRLEMDGFYDVEPL